MIEKKEDVCLLDSTTTHLILKDKIFFSTMTLCKANVHTISGPVEMIDGSRNATIMLPNGIILHIEDALLSTKTKKKTYLALKMYAIMGTISRQ